MLIAECRLSIYFENKSAISNQHSAIYAVFLMK